MRVATWNVNSIRARHEHVCGWLERHAPDVMALQETRCDDGTFALLARTYRRLGYESVHHGRDAHAGVALLSRVGLDAVEQGFPGVDVAPFDQPRLLSASCDGRRVYSVYAPNGRRFKDPQWYFKLDWLRLLRATVDGDTSTILAGDFNVQPTSMDVYDPAAWKNRNHGSEPERAAIRDLIATGLRDVTREHLPDPGVYTWWNYRPGQLAKNRGMRIDLVLCSDDIADQVCAVWIDRVVREAERPSDHAPVVVDIA